MAVALSTLGAALVPGTQLIAPADALAQQLNFYAGPDEAAKLTRIPEAALSMGLVIQAYVMGPLLNAPFMLSEELGWRGLLWSRWSRLGFWRHSLATGVVWGLWHAPLILLGRNYPDTPRLGVGLMTIFCVLLTPVLHLVRERGGTLVHACVFHGTVNAAATLGVLCIRTEGWAGRGIVGLPGFLVLAVMTAAVAWRSRAPRRAGSS